jgi:hypothetical protein
VTFIFTSYPGCVTFILASYSQATRSEFNAGNDNQTVSEVILKVILFYENYSEEICRTETDPLSGL